MMKDTVARYLDHVAKRLSRQRKAVAILLALSLIVAAGVTWSLHRTGESLSGTTYCGKEEHTHTEECIEKTLICGQEGTDASGDGLVVEVEQSGTQRVLTCGQEESAGHTHTDACYTAQTTLTCGQEESAGHTHSETCYQYWQTLVCGQEESAGHTHSEACYDADGNLICGQAESAGHTHSEACYITESALICGQEESAGHTHTDACYTTEYVLTCGQAESTGHTHTDACYTTETVPAQTDGTEHVHTDACYEEKTTCGKEEHTHSLACYSNPDADLETAADWEKTFADVELSGDYGTDVIAIAKTQLGYAESTENYAVEKDGNGKEIAKGYTRYGAWYGNAYGDWCAMFASFCLHYADVQLNEDVDYPMDAGCAAWIETLKATSQPADEDEKLYVEAKDWTPQVGDLVFFDQDADGISDHVGLVSALTKDGEELSGKDDPATANGIKTIEGNYSDSVQEVTYQLTDATLMGFGVLPVQEYTQTAQCGGYTVTVSYDNTAKMDKDAKLVVSLDDTQESQEDLSALLSSSDSSASDGSNVESLVELDIRFETNGVEEEPALGSSVEVQIAAAEGFDAENSILTVIHYPDDGETQVLGDVSPYDANGVEAVDFSLDSFSKVLLAKTSLTASSASTVPDHRLYATKVTENGQTYYDLTFEVTGDGTTNANYIYAYLSSDVTVATGSGSLKVAIGDQTALGATGGSSNPAVLTVGNEKIRATYYSDDWGLIVTLGDQGSGQTLTKDTVYSATVRVTVNDATKEKVACLGSSGAILVNSSTNTVFTYTDPYIYTSDASTATVDGVEVATTPTYRAWGAYKYQATTSLETDLSKMERSNRLYVGPSAGGDSSLAYCFNVDYQYPEGSKSNTASAPTSNGALNYWTEPYYKVENAANSEFETIALSENTAELPEGWTLQKMIYSIIWNGYPYDASGLKSTASSDPDYSYFSSSDVGGAEQMLYRSTQLAIWYYTDSRAVTDNYGKYLAQKIIAAAIANPAPDDFSMDLYVTDQTDGSKDYQNLLTVSRSPKTRAEVTLNKNWDTGATATDVTFDIYAGQDTTGNKLGSVTIPAGSSSASETVTLWGSGDETFEYITIVEQNGSPTSITSTVTDYSADTSAASVTLKLSNSQLSDYVYKLDATYTNPADGGSSSGGGSSRSGELEPSYEKYIKYNETDDNYDLTLNVRGALGSSSNKKKIDIVLVVDKSNTMSYSMDSESTASAGSSRLDLIKSNISSLVYYLSTTKQNDLDVMYSLVAFNESASAVQGWTSSGDTIKSKVDGLSASGSTNYQDALVKASAYVESAREEAETIVLFLTDGVPEAFLASETSDTSGGYFYCQPGVTNNGNHRYTSLYNWTSGYCVLDNNGLAHYPNRAAGATADQATSYYEKQVGYGTYSGWKVKRLCYEGALLGAQTITNKCDYFYAVGFSKLMGQTNSKVPDILTGQMPQTVLENVRNATNAVNTPDVTIAEDTTALNDFFTSFEKEIATIDVSNVTITDTLSEYAQVTDDAQLTITVKNASNEVVGTASAVVNSGVSLTLPATTLNTSAAELNATYSNGTFKLTFPSTYVLEEDWTYSVSIDIEASDAAYTAYAADKTYGGVTGDANTDDPTVEVADQTSSGKPGFRSNAVDSEGNTKAILTYTVNGTEKTAEYPHPVIQVKNTITIKKVWEDGDETIDHLNDSVTVMLYRTTKTKPSTVSDFDPVGEYELNAGNKWTQTLKLPAADESGNTYSYIAIEISKPEKEGGYYAPSYTGKAKYTTDEGGILLFGKIVDGELTITNTWNEYGGSDKKPTNGVTISKTIDATEPDASAEFSFTINVTMEDAEGAINKDVWDENFDVYEMPSYSLWYSSDTSAGAPQSFTFDNTGALAPIKVTLKHGEWVNIQITDASEDDVPLELTYTLTVDEQNTAGYELEKATLTKGGTETEYEDGVDKIMYDSSDTVSTLAYVNKETLTITKVWSDGADSHTDDTVTVNVYGLAEDSDEYEYVNSVKLGSGNDWTKTLTLIDRVLQDYESFYVEEVAVDGYTTSSITLDGTAAEKTVAYRSSSGAYSTGKTERFPTEATLYKISGVGDVVITNTKNGGSGGGDDNPGTETTDITPENEKYILDNKDGTYDLTLNVTGDVGSKENKQEIDIVLVIDASGSMKNNMLGYDIGESSSKLQLIKTNITNLVDSLSTNDNITVKYRMLTFGTSADSYTNWMNNHDGWLTGDEVKGHLSGNSVQSGGYTNYQDAMIKAAEAAKGKNDGAVSVVLFLTDGVPEACLASKTTSSASEYFKDYAEQWIYSDALGGGYNHYDYDGAALRDGQYEYFDDTVGTKGEYYNCCVLDNNGTVHYPYAPTGYSADIGVGGEYEGWDYRDLFYYGALMGAKTLSCDYFYAIGFGSEMTGARGDEISADITDHLPKTLLQNVTNATKATNKGDVKVASTKDELSQFFTDFEKNITYVKANNVTISDTLSEYAEAIDSATVTVRVKKDSSSSSYDVEKSFTLDADGNLSASTVTIPAGEQNASASTATVSYDKSTKLLTLDFADDYVLEDGWTYYVTIQIQPTDTAKNYYKTNSGYPSGMVGEDNTDDPSVTKENWTSSGKAGFFSNTTATLTYKVTGDDTTKTKDYPDPVIQVPVTADLTILKTNDRKKVNLEGAKFVLYKTEDSITKYYDPDADNGSFATISKTEAAKSTGSDGKLTFKGLAPGSYTLEETVAPAGYILPSGTITVNVSSDGVVTFPSGTYDWTVSGDTYTFTVPNNPGRELPNTGGTGTNMITLGGLALAAGSLVYGYGMRRRREREVRD